MGYVLTLDKKMQIVYHKRGNYGHSFNWLIIRRNYKILRQVMSHGGEYQGMLLYKSMRAYRHKSAQLRDFMGGIDIAHSPPGLIGGDV